MGQHGKEVFRTVVEGKMYPGAAILGDDVFISTKDEVLSLATPRSLSAPSRDMERMSVSDSGETAVFIYNIPAGDKFAYGYSLVGREMLSGRINGGVQNVVPFDEGFILFTRQVAKGGNEWSLLYLDSSGKKKYLELPKELHVNSRSLGEYYLRNGPDGSLIFAKRSPKKPGASIQAEVYELDLAEGSWSFNRLLPDWSPNLSDILASVPLKDGRLADVTERGEVVLHDATAPGEVEGGVIPDWKFRDEFGGVHSSDDDHFFIRQSGNVKIYSWDNLNIPVYDIDLPDHDNLFGGDCDISWVSTR
ncbi:MAG TPA: hypothetical protein H9867_07845 [Candidatus Corynebacterium gallistercoris]|uniref:Uncharacterized protein n=1 Tax=Candidatus Corynebacterium gallistercoris TaxID=2838530 RepID=A0A9D1URT6_9CORY|nr:hypothetical protein [Candidatus Corynebacterium gallistercoris]